MEGTRAIDMQIMPKYKGYDILSAAGSWMRTLIQLSVHSPSSLTFAFDLTRQAQGWCGYISLAFCSVPSLPPSYRSSAVKNSGLSAISISTGSTSFQTLSWLLATESLSFFLISFASLAMDAESGTSTKSIFLSGRGPEKSFLTNRYQMVAVDIADERNCCLWLAGHWRISDVRRAVLMPFFRHRTTVSRFVCGEDNFTYRYFERININVSGNIYSKYNTRASITSSIDVTVIIT
jgi:hypothetical protein